MSIAAEVSSSSTTMLTDLPLATLARIAFRIGDASYSEFVIDDHRWSEIQPFRATCRLFYEAANLIMRTLDLVYKDDIDLRIESTEDDDDHAVTIPLDTVLSLPCLHELRVFGKPIPNSLTRALEVIPGLKAVELNNQSESSTIRFKAFKRASTVERLNLWGLEEQAVKDLLSFRYDRLADLTLGDLYHGLVIPQHILASVKHVSLSRPTCRDVDLKDCYQSLTKGQNLQSLRFFNCTLQGMDFLHTNNRFAALEKLIISFIGESRKTRSRTFQMAN